MLLTHPSCFVFVTFLGICDVNPAAGCPLVKPPIQLSGCNRGYSTHINDVPNSLINSICILLDEERDIDGKDYTMLASMLNQTPVTIRHLKQQQKQSGKSPSYRLLLQIFASMKNSGTLKCLCSILEKMERYDVISVIDFWVANNPWKSTYFLADYNLVQNNVANKQQYVLFLI